MRSFFTVALLASSTLVSVEAVVDYAAVKADIAAFLPNIDADNGNYGPLMIRFAWHCSGTYRTSDGRGGCDGARIRFGREASWDDNKGLAEAQDLLQDIYDTYSSDGLSWGDLIILAGNTAIEEGGGPSIDFCGGRIDVNDGLDSPLDIDMIYVDAGKAGANDIRKAFHLMSMDDREVVALIGGGHAYGQCHVTTSGFDGPWTVAPTHFSNDFFVNLMNLNYTETTDKSPKRQYVTDTGLMMLHADMQLKEDLNYSAIVEEFAQIDNLDTLTTEFKAAWEKLTTSDMGHRPCAGEEPVPFVPSLDYSEVRTSIVDILEDEAADNGNYGPFLVRLAWHCAGTYRSTDHRGGCNGARIRHEPEADWGSNTKLDQALGLLEPIKTLFGDDLSWADLIVLAGTTALEEMGAPAMSFCPGRTDDVDGSGSAYLEKEIYIDGEIGTAAGIRESMQIMGFNAREMTVLNGGGHSVGGTHMDVSGFSGPWTVNPTQVSNDFFTTLLNNEWVETTSTGGKRQYTDVATSTLTMLHTDLEFKADSEFANIAAEYADDLDLFLSEFATAWLKLVNHGYWNCVTQVDTQSSATASSTASSTAGEGTSSTATEGGEGTGGNATTGVEGTGIFLSDGTASAAAGVIYLALVAISCSLLA